MNAGALITTTLLADGAVTALVATRIGPRPRVERQECPCVTYWRTREDPIYSHDGSSGLRYPDYYIKGWATDYETAQEIGAAVRPALERAGFMLTTSFDDYEADTGLHSWVAVVRVAETGG